jgi:hypothetical protein
MFLVAQDINSKVFGQINSAESQMLKLRTCLIKIFYPARSSFEEMLSI